jgi:hypothetical protein
MMLRRGLGGLHFIVFDVGDLRGGRASGVAEVNSGGSGGDRA